jgi:phenylacetate-CoA ligase
LLSDKPSLLASQGLGMKGLPVREFYELLHASERWAPERLLHWQEQQLCAIAEHARHTAPFYSLRLEKVFDRNGSFSFQRWRELPVMTREDLSKYREAALSRRPIPDHGPFYDLPTSGSTGHPVTVRTTRWLNDMSTASGWRSHRWHAIDWSKTTVRRFYVDGSKFEDGECLGPWGPPWLPRSKRGKLIYSSYRQSSEEFFSLIAAAEAAYVACHAATIEVLAHIAKGQKPLKLLGFMTSGEAVTSDMRRIAAEIFGAKVLELYSSKEAGAIAHPCPGGRGFHICAESVYVEILRDDGTSAEPGEAGRVVVTPFGSTALPLIRYDQGDRAVMGGRCPCGISLPLLQSIEGRTMQLFRHPDGRCQIGARIGPSRALVGSFPWQVAQVGPTRFEVRYEAEPGVQPAEPAKFVAKFRELFFEDAVLEFKQVAYFEQHGGKKKRMEYVNEWEGTHTADGQECHG